MPLESVVVCLDNSEWMRNGDYFPSRMASQTDSALKMCKNIPNGHPESTLGLLAMAGDNVQLLASPTRDVEQLTACFKKVQLGGESSFYNALKVAAIALKYVKNKAGSKRIIAFVGSPLTETTEKLTKLAQNLRTGNIRVDIICLGEIESNREKLTTFIQENSRPDVQSQLVDIPRGVNISDAIFASPIFNGDGGGMGGGAFGGDLGGADMQDADLQMALRISAEENRVQAQTTGSAAVASPAVNVSGGADFGDEDPELAMAIAMSMRELSNGVTDISIQSHSATPSIEQSTAGSQAADKSNISNDADDIDDEAALAMALAMSQEQAVSDSSSSSSASASKSDLSDIGDINPEYLAQLLKNVDVDSNNVILQSALASFTSGASADSSRESSSNSGSSSSGSDAKEQGSKEEGSKDESNNKRSHGQ